MRLTALDEAAEAIGLKPGQGVAEARAICPPLDVIAADDTADRQFLEAVADWCDRYTPLVALDGVDGIFLDITGCAHLFGGEKAMLDDVLKRLFHLGLDARGAVSSAPGLSWAAARFGKNGVIAEEEAADVLSPLPVAALRIPEETVLSLQKVGLRQIGDLIAAPRAPLARRLGTLLLQRLDQAFGREDEPVSPRRPVADLSVERRLAEPVQGEDDLLRLAGQLATTLKPELEARGLGGRRFELLLFRVDGRVFRIVVGTAMAVRDPARIGGLFAERFTAVHDDLDAGFGFEILRLNVLQAEAYADVQPDFSGAGAVDSSLAAFVDQAVARFGPECLAQPVLKDSHVPERASLLVPAVEEPAAERQQESSPAPIRATRPIRLLTPPEPVEAMAEVPEGAPMSFRWRRCFHRVRRAEGPERLAAEWWIDGEEAPTRDYFRIEDEAGRRYWLFREGLYEREPRLPRWFMHGVFA